MVARDNQHMVVKIPELSLLPAVASSVYGSDRYTDWLAQYNDLALPVSSMEYLRKQPDFSSDFYLTVPLGQPSVNTFRNPLLPQVAILCYHRFGKNQRTKMTVDLSDFRQQMAYLKTAKFNVVSLKSLTSGLSESTKPSPRTVVLTVDDGHKSFYHHAFPVIQEYGFPVTLFIYTDYVGKGGLSWAQLREMVSSGLVDVQPHSKTHANLAIRKAGESKARHRQRIREEVLQSGRLIQKRLPVTLHSFAYPYGDADRSVLKVMQSGPYKRGLTVLKGHNTPYTDPYLMRRTLVYGDQSWADFLAAAHGYRDIAVDGVVLSKGYSKTLAASLDEYTRRTCQKSLSAFRRAHFSQAEKWAQICLLLEPNHMDVARKLRELNESRVKISDNNVSKAKRLLKRRSRATTKSRKQAKHFVLESIILAGSDDNKNRVLRQAEEEYLLGVIADKTSQPAYAKLFREAEVDDRVTEDEDRYLSSNQVVALNGFSSAHRSQLAAFQKEIQQFERLLDTNQLEEAELQFLKAYRSISVQTQKIQALMKKSRLALADGFYSLGINHYPQDLNLAIRAWRKALMYNADHSKANLYYQKASELRDQ